MVSLMGDARVRSLTEEPLHIHELGNVRHCVEQLICIDKRGRPSLKEIYQVCTSSAGGHTHGVVWVDRLLLNHLAVVRLRNKGCIVLCVTTDTDNHLASALREKGHEVQERRCNVRPMRSSKRGPYVRILSLTS